MRRITAGRRFLAILAGIAGIGTALALAAPTAGASTRDDHGLRPEAFNITISSQFPQGLADAFGPIHFQNWTDPQPPPSGTLDRLVSPGGFNSIRVFHTNVDNVVPVINDEFCTATADGTGNWRIRGGTGRFREAFGFGQFNFSIVLVLARSVDGACDTNMNDQPLFFRFFVHAWGQATQGFERR